MHLLSRCTPPISGNFLFPTLPPNLLPSGLLDCLSLDGDLDGDLELIGLGILVGEYLSGDCEHDELLTGRGIWLGDGDLCWTKVVLLSG